MNNKPTGLMGSAIAETELERAQRRAKKEYIDNWIQSHPEVRQEYSKLTKAELIDLCIRRVLGDVYSSAMSMGSARSQNPELALAEVHQLCHSLLTGTPDEIRNAVLQWEQGEVATAGGNRIKLVEIGRISGATLARIELRPQVTTVKKVMAGLAAGRDFGAKAQKEYAAETWRLVDVAGGMNP